MTEKFENILEKCLDRITVKGESIEVCLRDYPEHASRLEPLLRTANSASSRIHHIQAVSEFKLKAKNKMLSEVQRRQREKVRTVRTFAWKHRWALPAMLLLLLLVSSGVVIASNDSMPDEPLYVVKTTMEKIQLKLTPSDVDKAKLHVKFAERRAEEMLKMQKKRKTQQVEKLTQNVKQELDNTVIIAESIKAKRNAISKIEKIRTKLQKATVLASSDGLSQETLYPVRIVVEDTLLKLTTSELSQAKLRIEFAEQRVQKMVEISNNDNYQELNELSQSVEQHLGNLDPLIESLMSQGGKERDVEEIRALLENDATRNIDMFNETLEKASAQVKPALKQALERARLRFDTELTSLDKIRQNMEQTHGGELP